MPQTYCAVRSQAYNFKQLLRKVHQQGSSNQTAIKNYCKLQKSLTIIQITSAQQILQIQGLHVKFKRLFISPRRYRYFQIYTYLYLLLHYVCIKKGMAKQFAFTVSILWDTAVQSHMVFSVVTTSWRHMIRLCQGWTWSSWWHLSLHNLSAMTQ